MLCNFGSGTLGYFGSTSHSLLACPTINLSLLQTPTCWFVWPPCVSSIWTCADNFGEASLGRRAHGKLTPQQLREPASLQGSWKVCPRQGLAVWSQDPELQLLFSVSGGKLLQLNPGWECSSFHLNCFPWGKGNSLGLFSLGSWAHLKVSSIWEWEQNFTLHLF